MAMAFSEALDQWYKDHPELFVQHVEDTMAQVVAERILYPFKPTSLVRNQNGTYTAW